MPPSGVRSQSNKMQKDGKAQESSETALLTVIKPAYQSDSFFIWQWLHGTMGFAAPHTAPAARRMGVSKDLGGDAAGRVDPDWPKGHSRPHSLMLSSKSWEDEMMKKMKWWHFPSQVAIMQ